MMQATKNQKKAKEQQHGIIAQSLRDQFFYACKAYAVHAKSKDDDIVNAIGPPPASFNYVDMTIDVAISAFADETIPAEAVDQLQLSEGATYCDGVRKMISDHYFLKKMYLMSATKQIKKIKKKQKPHSS